MDAKKDYGNSLNLPQTEFPMRANLPQREPQLLAKWKSMAIYAEVQKKNAGRPKFILHDGPPYANGNIHLGHVLNKTLKDIVVKYKSMSGFDAPYVPGWDTHGLPIEQKAIKDLGLNKNAADKVAFREKCREYALKYVDVQKEQFQRMGVRGDWGHPYLTLQPEFEAVQIRAFGEMAQKGYIYKGKKPVYWCADCETALAEAEVEYADDKAPTIYVKFPVKDGKGLLSAADSFVIWTTTPWTIPANLGICLHPDYTYVVANIDGENMVLAKELLQSFMTAADQKEARILKEFKGRDLEYITCRHPLFDRESLVILGDHVTLDAGTGCVHTAPGHGVDDFEVGRKYNLAILSPVDHKGRMTAEAGAAFAGMTLDEANRAVCKALDEKGALMGFKIISHQYPHCWRCKQPIVFRATEQWFCSIDGFREQALSEIDKVNWIPSWGHDRIYNMVRDRSDWCISRQRTWGVPIPIFYCGHCGKEIITAETIDKIASIFAKEGSQAWYRQDVCELIPEGLTCPACGGKEFRKETDIMDVWFDSGSSHLAVLDQNPALAWPADLYLEGSDQHRGWFNSSLNIAVAVKGKAPYKTVLTHGFLVDEKGMKLSKSKGNFIDPLQAAEQMGADVLRLWVASADYRNDLANSPNIMKQVSEAYRKIRNTARFLLSNIYDFEPQKDSVAYEEMPELEKLVLHKLAVLIDRVLEAYENYEFHVVYHAIHKFCVVEMSNFYLDIRKDCLYVEKADDPSRRAVQTVLYEIINALVRLLVPILAFTSEEIYSFLPKGADAPASVQLLDMPKAQQIWYNQPLADQWETMMTLREKITKYLETARQEKVIGHSLDAAVTVYAEGENYRLLSSLGEFFASLLIVSQANALPLTEKPHDLPAEDQFAVKIAPAKGEKCERCWMYSTKIGQDPQHADLCPRCANVLK